MTFKKINENKLIISFHSIELPEFMDLDNLVSNTDKLKQIFINLLDEAKEKVGFNADDYTINVDTKVTLNNDIIIEVTKLIKTNNHKIKKSRVQLENVSLPKSSKSNGKSTLHGNSDLNKKSALHESSKLNEKLLSQESGKSNKKSRTNIKVKPKLIVKPDRIMYSVYKFADLDDFINFCAFLKSSNKKINIKKISNECFLFKYSSYYFLTLKNINEKYSEIGLFYTGITEFSKFCLNSDSLFSILNEYGTLFIPNNALINTIKSFC